MSDLEAALKFYSDHLGHEVLWKTSTAVGMKFPDSNAELVISTENGPETDLTVEDARAAFKDLIAAGAKPIAEPFEIAIGYCAVVEDPWGNQITILDTTKGILKVDDQQIVIGNLTDQ